ncbi:hypothetical protein CVT24_002325 [Panaeolus cyanescens]|uniref:F-box domain-containing protein n=1 Tax=Panaeolus cyanescens TaxID=181874 RepID=A0A409YIL2_9AGAR|nr:hypothetical protein CVT24_002325 [Panaeolus cyanescens]
MHFNDLPLDVVLEILAHLGVPDIVRCRSVCKRLLYASHETALWFSVYQKSKYLLPPIPPHALCGRRLEFLIARASRIDKNWRPETTMRCVRRSFPHNLPTYEFVATVISGRYLQLAKGGGLSWYDLDSGDMSTPIMTYPCPIIVQNSDYVSHQTNADNEGHDTIWVSFVSAKPKRIVVLKARFGKMPSVKLHLAIPARTVTCIKMAYDWLLPINEFSSRDDPIELIHIPSCSVVPVPMHSHIQSLTDLNNMRYIITPKHLFFLFAMREQTHIEVYPLPVLTPCRPWRSNRPLARSHSGLYLFAISSIHIVGQASNFPPTNDDTRVLFLALVYVNRSRTSWTSKIGLHLFEAHLNSHGPGSLGLNLKCQRILDIGIATTTLSLSANSDTCLAVTHSLPGPVVLAHSIRNLQSSRPEMHVKALKMPDRMQSRDMLTFDGVRGRLCLVSGWTRIEILDFDGYEI